MKHSQIAIILFLSAVLCACQTTQQEEILSGILEVPENRNDPKSRTLSLAYKVLKAKKADPTKFPIVYLQGGPGVPTLIMEEFWAKHPLRDDRDIVLMDQRGTGASEANCTNVGELLFISGREDHNVEQDVEALAALMAKCKKEIQQKGVDLEGYNSREIAADFEDLRKALGYKKWNLYGASYGTQLGLTIMRDFPEGIRSSILLAVSPPESNQFEDRVHSIERSFLKIFQKCKEDINCDSRYPNLEERLRNVLTKMETEPLIMEYKNKPYVLNSHEAFGLIFASLYDRNSIGNIPLLIEALETKSTQPIIELMKSFEPFSGVINFPMEFSVFAYDEIPFYDRSELEMAISQSKFGYAMSSYFMDIKLRADWHPYRASAIENRPVTSDIPTLLLSGVLDPVAPPSNAAGALKHLKN